MKICGLQKTTLLDYPGHVAATIFLGGCNFRCPFCHNSGILSLSEITPEELLDEAEVLAFLKKRSGILEGVCITGGEPTLQPGLKEFISKIKQIGLKVKLDTNGYKPDVLKELCEAGLIDMVAMDIKNAPGRYAETAGIPEFHMERIQESVEYLKTQQKIPYEFRTTVVREFHTEKDIRAIGEWLAGESAYFLQAYKDSSEVLQSGLSGYEKDELHALLAIAREYLPGAGLRGVD